MVAAIEETSRRRDKQLAYNAAHGITPQTVVRAIREMAPAMQDAPKTMSDEELAEVSKDLPRRIRQLERQMREASKDPKFEETAKIRDGIEQLEDTFLRASGELVGDTKLDKATGKPTSTGDDGPRSTAGRPGGKAGKRRQRSG